LIVTVDGRQPGWSLGYTLVQFANEMKREGAVTALNLDGAAPPRWSSRASR
jgi:exopolysaccharide biosynthesis protein